MEKEPVCVERLEEIAGRRFVVLRGLDGGHELLEYGSVVDRRFVKNGLYLRAYEKNGVSEKRALVNYIDEVNIEIDKLRARDGE